MLNHAFLLQTRKIFCAVFVISGLLFSQTIKAQVSGYDFTASSGSFTPLTGGIDVDAIEEDDVLSGTIPIGFTFEFDGVNYTDVKASSNGFIIFNTASTSTSSTNNLSTSISRPALAPLWDDLDGRATGGSTASYLTEGVAPNRVFTFEWLNWEWNWLSNNPVISFQVKLFEGSNAIEFVYRQESGAVSNGNASIGISGVATGAGNFLSLNNTSATPTVSSSTETNNINVKPATGQVYRFEPPFCSAPSQLNVAALTSSSANLVWTSSVGLYDIDFATMGTPLLSGTITNGNTDTFLNVSSLQANTTYRFFVRSDCGGGILSNWSGPFVFTTPLVPVTAFPFNEDWESGSGAWAIANGTQTNKWINGTATNNGGTSAIYISNDNGTSFTYSTGSTSVVHFYKDFSFPVGSPLINLSFDWLAQGEGTAFDRMRVFVVPVSFVPTAGVEITTTGTAPLGRIQVGQTNFNLQPNYTTANITLPPAYEGQTVRLVFQWRNDGSGGTQPPAAVDNINISVSNCTPPVNLTANNITATSAQLNWSSSQTLFDIEYSVAPLVLGNGTFIQGISDTFISINNLTPGTPYQFTAKADCGSALSPYSVFGSFVTALDNNNPACFSAGTLPIPDNGCSASNFLEIPIEVSGVSGDSLGTDIILSQIDLVIAHTWNSDLNIELESPSGQIFNLVNGKFGSGDNLGNPLTCPNGLFTLEDGAAPMLTTATNNVVGVFQPEDALTSFNDGTDPNGVWLLRICDDAGGDTGNFRYVQLFFEDPCTGFSVSLGADQFLCAGDSLTLNANNGDQFNWSTSDTSSSVVVSPLNDASFSITVTENTFGCVASDTVEITVVALPLVDAGNDTTICEGSSVVLTATGGNTYLWDTGATTASITVNPLADSTFTVTAFENINNCSATASVSVFVNPTPLVGAGNDTVICLGASVDLTASGLGNFEWSTSETTASISVTPLVATTFSVTITDASGCTATDDVFVDVNTLSGLVPSQVDVCLGSSTTITATGGDTYLWSNGDTTASTTLSPLVDVSLSVTITVSGSCTVVESVQVSVLPLPTADAGSDQTICPGTTATLSGQVGVSFLWSSGDATATTLVAPLADATFVLTVTDANGCSDSDSVAVTLYPAPLADAGADVVICNGGTANLSASGGVTFAWSTSETTASISVSPLVDETFTVTVTDALGCTATDDVTVSIEVPSVPELTPDVLSVCSDEVINFVSSVGAIFISSITDSIRIPDNSLVGASLSVNISGASGFIDSTVNLEITINNLRHTWDSDLDIYLVGPNNCGTLELSTDNGGGGDNYINTVLSTSATAPVTGGTAPFTGTFRPEGTVNTPPLLNSGTGGGTYSLPATPLNGCPVNGAWTLWVFDDTGGDVGDLKEWTLQISEPTPVFTSHILTGNGTLNATLNQSNSILSVVASDLPVGENEFVSILTSSNGCVTTDTAFITVFGTPEILNINTICASNNDGEIQVAAVLDNGTLSGVNIGTLEYSFDGGATFGTDSFATGLAPGIFQVIVRNSANPACASAPIDVTISTPPVALVTNTAPVCEGQDINLNAQASGGIVAQIFSGNNAAGFAIPDGSLTGASSPVQINGTGTVSSASVISVNLNITHTFVGDVDIYLEGPNACGTLELSTDNGGGGDNFTGTQFSTDATTLISSGTPPFTGTFLPEGNIIAAPNLNSGTGAGTYAIAATAIDACPVSGTWTLWVFDDAGADAGTLNNWSLEISNPGDYIYSISGPGVLGTPSFSGISNSQASVSIFDAPIGENEFIITVEDITGCSSVTSSFANVFDTPSNIVATATCADANGGSISVTADPIDNANFSGLNIGQWEYSFDGGTTWTINDNATGLLPATYQVLVRNSANPACASTAISVEVFEVPTVSVNDPGLCAGANVDLIALSPNTVSYEWSTGETTSSINVNTTGDFFITVTDANGCSASDTASVTTSTSLTVVIDDATFCDGDSVVLDASNPGATYLWSPNGETTQTITVFSSDIYSVVVNAAGCSGTDSSTVTVNPNPIAGLADAAICDGDTFTFDAQNTGSTYLWSPNGATTQTIAVTDAAVYQVLITNSFGCVISDTAELTVNPLPIVNLNDTLACQGNVVVLDAENAGSSYAWLPNGETSQTIDVTVADVYSVTVTDVNNCTATDSAVISFNPAPGANAGNDQTICEGATAFLIGTGNGDFEWSEGSTSLSISVSPTVTETFFLTVTDVSNSCTSIDSVTVNVNPSPAAAISGDTSICSNIGTTLTATGGVSYEWSNAETTDVINVLPQANETFFVTVTDANACTASASINIEVTTGPEANAGSDVGICEGNTITIFGSGGTDFLWSTGDTTANLTVSPLVTSSFILTVNDNSGCEDVDTITIFVNPLPTVSINIADVAFCDTEAPTPITGTPAGGQFNGTGIVGNNFEPATAGVGSYLLTYTFTDANQCTNMADVAVAVQVCVGVEDIKNALADAQVFPNPFNHQINIAINALDADEIVLQLFDVLGKQVASSTKQILPGANLLTLENTNNLAGGVYYLKLIKEDVAVSFRMVKMD